VVLATGGTLSSRRGLVVKQAAENRKPAMTAIGALSPDNPFDALRAELCRPAEVREQESYLSKSVDGDDREQVDDAPTPQPPPPADEMPPGGWISSPQPRLRPRVDGSVIADVPLPLRSAPELPPGRFVTTPVRSR
jgi:hypothetical protein